MSQTDVFEDSDSVCATTLQPYTLPGFLVEKHPNSPFGTAAAAILSVELEYLDFRIIIRHLGLVDLL